MRTAMKIHAVVAASLVLAACASVQPALPSPRSEALANTPAGPGTSTIFLAVLEGLYEEGVASDDVDILLRTEPTTGRFVHFVPGCPLCNPAIDALRLYRGRQPFFGLKGGADTFGAGLSERERSALRGDGEAQRGVLHDFVERCIQRKIASLRLSPAEREHWQLVLQEMRDKGGELLRVMQESGTAGPLVGAKGCPVCDGMRDGGTWMRR